VQTLNVYTIRCRQPQHSDTLFGSISNSIRAAAASTTATNGRPSDVVLRQAGAFTQRRLFTRRRSSSSPRQSALPFPSPPPHPVAGKAQPLQQPPARFMYYSLLPGWTTGIQGSGERC